MASSGRRVIVLALLLASAGCVAPITQMGSVSQEDVAIERSRQQQFVLQSALKDQFRVQNVANPILVGAASICGENVRPMVAFSVGNAYLWKKEYFAAALALGYNDTLVVLNVSPEMPAALAGLQVGDRIEAIDGTAVMNGERGVPAFFSSLPVAKGKPVRAFTLTYRRGSETGTVTIHPRIACAFTLQVVENDDINALSDGQSIVINTGILRFTTNDDELAVIIGHELAHNAMHHLDAQKKNSFLGGLAGLLADVGMAAAGVNTKGEFTKQGMELGAMVFSQDFEREADYVGLYALALSGRPIEGAPNFWRRMAAAHPGNIRFATSHPTTAERFVRLDKWRAEIGRKVASGQALFPELKNRNSAFAARARTADPKLPNGTIVATAAVNNRSSTGSSDPTTVSAPTPSKAAVRKPTDFDRASAPATPSAAERSVRTSISSDDAASSIIGEPESESARAAAVETFAQANAYVGSHEWTKAVQKFHETLRLDGSVAKYHAALGRQMMLQQHWLEAQASYTAAVLLDIDNTEYKRLLKEARSHR